MNSHRGPDPAVDLRVTTTLSQVVDVLNAHGARYALIGGLGVALRGAMRATEDVDILMHIAQLRLPSLLEAMRDRGCQLDVDAAIREWNDGGMLAVQWPERVQVDLLKPDFIESLSGQVRRRSTSRLYAWLMQKACCC